MKILRVDLLYDYGIKTRGLNLIGENGFKKSLMKLGHEVYNFYYDDLLNNLPLLQIKLLEYADQIKPDLIFFSLFNNQFKTKTLLKLKKKYIITNWFGDDTWRFDSFSKEYANCFNFCITTDQFSVDKYKSIGVENIIFSQWAAIDNDNIPKEAKYKYDVSFVGGYHPYRKWVVDQLKTSNINVVCFGNGWENGSLSNQEMNQLFVESKINLNLSNSTSLNIKYLISNPKNIINSIRSPKNGNQIKARNFEICYFGGFQLTEYVPSIESYYNIGSEIICFNNTYDLKNLIFFYLKHDSLREKIRKAGKERAQLEHGYTHRLKQVLEDVRT